MIISLLSSTNDILVHMAGFLVRFDNVSFRALERWRKNIQADVIKGHRSNVYKVFSIVLGK